jgi:hypothetical protein
VKRGLNGLKAKNGLLSDVLSLQSRQESYWTLGSAVQGASAVGTGILVALLAWGPRNFRDKPDGIGSDFPVSFFNKLDSYFVQHAEFVYFGFALIALSGVFAILYFKNRWIKGLGALLIACGFLSTAKLNLAVNEISFLKDLKLDVNASIKASIKEQLDSNVTVLDPTTFRIYEIPLPPFATASDEVTKSQKCGIAWVGQILKNAPEVHEIAIQSSADRRELLPAVKKKFASNFGLSRKRAESVVTLLISLGIPKTKLVILNVGPKNTEDSSSSIALEKDRIVLLRVATKIPLTSLKEQELASGIPSSCDS